MKHKHEWVRLLPKIDDLPTDIRISLYVEMLGNAILNRTVVCWCGKTGHRINSRRGGIRIHTSDYFLNEAKRLAGKYNFELPNLTNVSTDKKQ